MLRTLTIALVLSLTASGCYVRARGRVVAPSVRVAEVDDYEPEYYDDYIVYYDDRGEPYYYDGGRIIYVERTHPRYRYYVNHWRAHRDVYLRWHARYRGDRYHRRGQWHRRHR